MPFFESVPPAGGDLVYALLAFQDHHHCSPSFFKALASELKHSASNFECLVCEQGVRTVILLGIFDSAPAYKRWWSSASIQSWWRTLPPRAGVWREVYSIPASRFQSGFNQPTSIGIGNVYAPQPSTRAGFWGAYRSRIPDSAHDEFQPSPSFKSSFVMKQRKPLKVDATRVLINRNPKNLCLIREGQDYTIATPHERSSSEYWGMRKAADAWLRSLEKGWDRLGGLSFLRCSRVSDTALDSLDKLDSLDELPTTDDYVQIALFQSLGHVERLARASHNHLHLHSSLTTHYCPMGKFQDGQCGFWVEMGILPCGSVEAEYVGCYEGTGLMEYRGLAGFCPTSQFSWNRALLVLLFAVVVVALAAIFGVGT